MRELRRDRDERFLALVALRLRALPCCLGIQIPFLDLYAAVIFEGSVKGREIGEPEHVFTGSHEKRIGTRCGLINFALDGRQKRTRSLFGPLLETSSKRTSRPSLSRSELQANQLARAFLACRSGRDRGGKPALLVLKKSESHCARVRARWQA